jgi:signal transduction histidine kinase/CheY-like chemotaxis protein
MDEPAQKQFISTNAGVLDSDSDALQLTLAGMVVPFWIHLVFNALTALCAILLGHPMVAAGSLLSNCSIDAIFQRRIGRWLGAEASADLDRGFSKLALLCAVRNSIMLAPAILMAQMGGLAEIAYLGLSVCSVIILASGNGSLSRKVFWAYAGPGLLVSLGFSLAHFAGAAAFAILIALLSLATLLALISNGTTKAVGAWHDAFAASCSLITELEQARDRALAERVAADEAREEARRANRAKSNFLATMSHEIRTPMNGVLGMAQLLKREETDPRQAERLDVLAQSGEHLLSILNDILDVSKIDEGRLEITPQIEDLRQFLDEAVGFWGARADEKGVALQLEVAEAVPRAVWMDALRVRQVLFNLVGNALKFTEAGAVVVQVSANPLGDTTTLLRIAVRDTGPGIPAEHLPDLFERFSQADASEVRRFGGTGLGLAIAKQLTELMGGVILAESTVGEGSQFQIELRLECASMPDCVVQADGVGGEAWEGEAGAAAADLDLLIVDDNAVNLLVLEQLLAPFGHRIVTASEGPEALERLARQAFDMVLMDIQMPGMTGIEVLRRLRATPGPNADVPVIALTADVTSGGRARYLELGFNEHGAKPIQIVDLLGAMARALCGSEARGIPNSLSRVG